MTRALGDPTHPTAPPLDTTACAQHPYRQPVPLNRIVGGRESGGAEGLQALPCTEPVQDPCPFLGYMPRDRNGEMLMGSVYEWQQGLHWRRTKGSV